MVTREEFQAFEPDEKVQYIKDNGLKVEAAWGNSDTASVPEPFRAWPDVYWHYVNDESTGSYAILWVLPDFSPSNAITAIANSNSPILTVLEDNTGS